MSALDVDVVLAHEGAPGSGGVAVNVRNLAQGLPAEGVRPIIARTTRAATEKIWSQPGGVVHVFGCLPTSITFRLLPIAKAAGRPIVWTPVFHPSRPNSWRGYRLLRAMQVFDLVAPRVARFVDAVLAATEADAAFFGRLGARRVALIPPSVPLVSTRDADGDSLRLRSAFGLGPGPVVLVVARDNRRKGLPFALRSYSRLRQLHPDAQLLLLGPPSDHVATSLRGVHCPGWLAPDEVDRAYRAADLLFVSSLYEVLPRVVLEGWRERLPVVATDRVGLAPTIDGVGGEIVPYGNTETAAQTLARLLSDPATLSRYGAAGRRLVNERYGLSRQVQLTADIYRELRDDTRA